MTQLQHSTTFGVRDAMCVATALRIHREHLEWPYASLQSLRALSDLKRFYREVGHASA